MAQPAKTAWEREQQRYLLIAKELSNPFHVNDLEFRIGASFGSGDGAKGMPLVYVTSRAVTDRMDNALGPGHWSFKILRHEERGKEIVCHAQIRVLWPGNLWTEYEDVGTGEGLDKWKGSVSDALKRCASRLGIGRYLYDVGDIPWVEGKKDDKGRFKPNNRGWEEAVRQWFASQERLAWARPGGSGLPDGRQRVSPTLPHASHLEPMDSPPAAVEERAAALESEPEPPAAAEPVVAAEPEPESSPIPEPAWMSLHEGTLANWQTELDYGKDVPEEIVAKRQPHMPPVGRKCLGIGKDEPRGADRYAPVHIVDLLPPSGRERRQPRWLLMQHPISGPHRGRYYLEAIEDKAFRQHLHQAAGSPENGEGWRELFDLIATYCKAAELYLRQHHPNLFK